MNWLDFIVLTLAGSGVLEAWFKGSIFGPSRELMKLKDDAWEAGTPIPATPSQAVDGDQAPESVVEEATGEPLRGYLRMLDRGTPDVVGAMLSCDFCFSYHACFWFGLVFWVPSLFLAEPWSAIIKFPLYSLAATRAGNILTGMLPPRLRYKEVDDEPAGRDTAGDDTPGSPPEDV